MRNLVLYFCFVLFPRSLVFLGACLVVIVKTMGRGRRVEEGLIQFLHSSIENFARFS